MEKDCAVSLTAAIRDDAVWVNRSNIFDQVIKKCGKSFNREKIWDFLDPFFALKTSDLYHLFCHFCSIFFGLYLFII